jgi:diguanylate cyclase (GGDEF)-like protein
MTASEWKQDASATAGSERRQTRRYNVDLSAVCHHADGSAIACEIKDICLTGTYLVFRQSLAPGAGTVPAVGEQVELECFLPAEHTPTRIRLTAKVVRHYASGAGVAFVNPEPAVQKVLQSYIAHLATERRQSAALSDKDSSDKNAAPSSPKAILNACARVFVAQARPLARSFLASVDEDMLKAAEMAGNNSDQNSFFDSLGILKQRGRFLSDAFHKAVIQELNSHTQRQNDTPTDTASPDHGELSLMEDDRFEDWLAVKNIINQVRTTCHTQINELERRLSTLYGRQINANNNPFDPGVYAHAFDSTLHTFGFDHKINLLCLGTFNTVLTAALQASYASALEILAENGIEAAVPNTVTQVDSSAPDADQSTTTESHAEDPSLTDVSSPATTGTPSRADGGKQTIYNLVRELRQLKSQVRNQPPSGGDGLFFDPAAIAEDSSSSAEFSTDEIVDALSLLQSSHPQTGGMDNDSIATRAVNILREQNDRGEPAKHIGARDGNIMDVTSNLFETLLHDILVADSVREWINKLEIPILKLALRDDSVFTDRDHAARQVLNKIAQLEGYTSYSPNGSKNAIWDKIDTLLERIAARIDSDPEIFSDSLKEVDSLIRIQDKAFTENIQEVINECNRSDDETETAFPDTIAGRTELEPWEKQTLRLRPDDWLNFINTASGNQRLRLAWISRNHARYVFVNLKGLKEKTLTFEQLSRGLHEGTIIPLGGDNEFAVDRAQQSMLDRLHKQLLFESTHDTVTGLINRREFEHRLDNRLLRLSGRHNQDVLCYVDIAQFGVINSTYGYEAGDRLLTEMAGLLLRTVNGRGQLARVSDDAYAILLEEQSVTDARDLIQQQLTLLKDFRFQWDGKELSIAMNTGLVPISDYDASAPELLRTAELCCTTAREKGGNYIHIYQRDDAAASLHQNIIQHVLEIENTIDNHHIELLRQKIMPIQADQADIPHHSEIIIRATDDQGRQLPTQDFILAAEHHDRITALDRWVVTSVLEWMQQHRDEMADIGGFAINLSGRSLNDAEFLDFIHSTVSEAGIPTEWICFEITETADINSLSDAAEFIHRIRETGCHFSLDDFGSGLSSYTYLKNLPVDYLKIDGTFVRNMHENPNDYAVVKSICDIGHFMGKQIIAEFVENDEILTLLRELGVDYAQGWGIEKPQPLV